MKILHELTIRGQVKDEAQLEILRVLLGRWGFSSEDLIEVYSFPYCSLKVFFTSRIKAEKIKERLKKFNIRGFSIKLKKLNKEDWVDKWKEEFKPFALTKRIEIIPISYAGKHRALLPESVVIDNTFAFGTGLHETTRFMANLIESLSGRFSSFLDIGTGTGILTLVALKNGGKNPVAVDISKEAVKVAQANLKINGYRKNICSAFDFSRMPSTQKFDFVAANLITHDLITMKDKIISRVKPGGWLAVSGISRENYGFFRKNFDSNNFRCQNVKKGKDWTAVLYKKFDVKKSAN